MQAKVEELRGGAIEDINGVEKEIRQHQGKPRLGCLHPLYGGVATAQVHWSMQDSVGKRETGLRCRGGAVLAELNGERPTPLDECGQKVGLCEEQN